MVLDFDDNDRGERSEVAAPQEPRRTRFVYQDRASNFIAGPEHLSIFSWVRAGSGHGMVEALAGTGKTSTLIEVLGIIDGDVFFGAFGQRSMIDIQQKVERARLNSYRVHVATLHGAGLAAWMARHEHANVEPNKMLKLIEAKFGKNHFAEAFIRHMVSYGKQLCAGIEFRLNDYARWHSIMLHYGADEFWPENKPVEEGFDMIVAAFEDSLETCKDTIDYDDMLFAPLARDVSFRKKDWVLGDEWQDANRARQLIVSRMLNTRGRALFVGDRNQSIFGFAGALAEAMDITKQEMNCHEMSLTTTWRCSEEVTNYAQQWVPHIRCRPDAPKGAVRPVTFSPGVVCPKCHGATETISGIVLPLICSACGSTGRTKPEPWYIQDRVTRDDAILCRYNRPLIQTAYNLIRNGIPCKVEGRDIGTRLVQLARRWKVAAIEALEPRLTNYLIVMVKRARDAGSLTKELEVTDRVDTLRVFIEQCLIRGETTIDDLCRAINSVFEDNVKDMITLSTIHKFKGRERRRIYWLKTAVRKKGLQPWEEKTERNLDYVAITRSRDDLIEVPEDVHAQENR